MTGTTTSGKPLNAENLRKTTDGCAMALELDEDKRLVRGEKGRRETQGMEGENMVTEG